MFPLLGLVSAMAGGNEVNLNESKVSHTLFHTFDFLLKSFFLSLLDFVNLWLVYLVFGLWKLVSLDLGQNNASVCYYLNGFALFLLLIWLITFWVSSIKSLLIFIYIFFKNFHTWASVSGFRSWSLSMPYLILRLKFRFTLWFEHQARRVCSFFSLLFVHSLSNNFLLFCRVFFLIERYVFLFSLNF